ncbi:FAD-dependent oxidoreductase domain-containing protein 1-like isoform X2 [Chrysoperla carnea]|uniref:FAD-dependent oxidoreductase domain-containing protein 1-like isoform X2 n=1 Tax=Chrysoperla carnea TaxID=189513 RepID=UPI001D07F6CB|nr:FAD-dependent oxidoreductase domain-containing protein 1-like isoform X2 [Chrysoperla carnea]
MNNICSKVIKFLPIEIRRNISTSQTKCKIEHEHPFNRTGRILGNDMKTVKSWFSGKKPNYKGHDGFPSHCDVCIIGGGAIGSSIAFWLKRRAKHGVSVVVVEKDCTYKEASTVLSVGGIRQQFSLAESISMSLFGAEFLRNIKKYCNDDSIDVSYTPNGYLSLASSLGVEQLKENYKLGIELGAKHLLLTRRQLKEKFPWLNVDNIELGCYGLENEGWFDPWALLYGLKKSSLNHGAEYVTGEAVDFEFKAMPDMMTDGVKLPNGELKPIKFALCVIAAGAHSGKIAQKARIGVGKGLLSIPLPIEPRKRYVYCFECKDGPGLNTPLTIDPTGTYFRKEGLGGCYISGKSPCDGEEEPSCDNLEVDHSYFENVIWPNIAHRVPAFEALKYRSSWAGFYEYNYFDQNGVVGPHPYYTNLYIASGFSGHGIQHSPAVGRAVAEMILDGRFETVDLTRLGFDRLVVGKGLYEAEIV